jgi:hypothetical protein
LRKGGGRALGGAGLPGERVGALADGGKRLGRGVGPSGNRSGGALQPADHAADFKVEQFQDFLGGIGLRGSQIRASRRRGCRLKRGRNRFQPSFPEQRERHGFLDRNRQLRNSSLHLRVNSWLTITCRSGQRRAAKVRKGYQLFDFARDAAYNAALSASVDPLKI